MGTGKVEASPGPLGFPVLKSSTWGSHRQPYVVVGADDGGGFEHVEKPLHPLLDHHYPYYTG
jgi:hypothetical protein